ncbi:uncharacterized protein [Dysidea avara]|uniref:uncharacterized protein n=1 Tax=Dysidea avara TaxID=196820 RepID=UPI003317D677
MYVNVPELNNLLQQHDPRKPYYIGSCDKPKFVHPVQNDTLEKLKKENITVASNSYQVASGAAYCISHPLMMELKHLLNGGKAFYRMCAMCTKIDDHMIGFSIVSILGYSRELSRNIKTQQSKHLDSVTLKDMLKYFVLLQTVPQNKNI